MKIIVVLASRSFIYYVINVYDVPRVRANAYQALTTPPRVFSCSETPKCAYVIYGQPLSNVRETFQAHFSSQ